MATKAQIIEEILDIPIEYHYMTHDEMMRSTKKALQDYLQHLQERYNRDYPDMMRD